MNVVCSIHFSAFCISYTIGKCRTVFKRYVFTNSLSLFICCTYSNTKYYYNICITIITNKFSEPCFTNLTPSSDLYAAFDK